MAVFRNFNGLFSIQYLEECSYERLNFLMNEAVEVLEEEKKAIDSEINRK